jgi:hypothetical protein
MSIQFVKHFRNSGDFSLLTFHVSQNGMGQNQVDLTLVWFFVILCGNEKYQPLAKGQNFDKLSRITERRRVRR